MFELLWWGMTGKKEIPEDVILASKSKELQISKEPAQKLSPQKRKESKLDKGVLQPSQKTASLSKDTIKKDISQVKEIQEERIKFIRRRTG